MEKNAGEMFSGQIHGLGFAAEEDGAVVIQGEWRGGCAALLHGAPGEAEPACVDPQNDLLGTHFHHGVMGAGEAVQRGVGSEAGGPGGPEFAVQLMAFGHALSFAQEAARRRRAGPRR
jgi:hypothetical protein